ncbi:MAG TPA: hypothetical protein V6D25_31580 [Leptolyngbyaceae cyanobacterium]
MAVSIEVRHPNVTRGKVMRKSDRLSPCIFSNLWTIGGEGDGKF